jgi:hypothetical protein
MFLVSVQRTTNRRHRVRCRSPFTPPNGVGRGRTFSLDGSRSPCIRQRARPLTAACRQGEPALVLAPHRASKIFSEKISGVVTERRALARAAAGQARGRDREASPADGAGDLAICALITTPICSPQTKKLYLFALYPVPSGAASDRGHSARQRRGIWQLPDPV